MTTKRHPLIGEDMVTLGTQAMNSTRPQVSMATLLALLHDPRESSIAELACQFEIVHRLIESPALTSAEYCFAHNWLVSARKLCEAGDYGAARYQVTAVARKLNILVTATTPPT